jgi:hypothetical protein
VNRSVGRKQGGAYQAFGGYEEAAFALRPTLGAKFRADGAKLLVYECRQRTITLVAFTVTRGPPGTCPACAGRFYALRCPNDAPMQPTDNACSGSAGIPA